MYKFANKDFIMKLTMLFLMLQPILDIKLFYDFEIIGVTFPTIIRLVFFGILFILFLIDRKKLKFTVAYFIIFIIYSIFHFINANKNYINVSGNYSIISEIIYLVRLAIPMLFILFSYNYKFDFKKISKIFISTALFFSLTIIITNIIGIAYPSYTHVKEIAGNIFRWPFLSKIDYGYYDLATKGLFGYANPLSGLMCLILPILLYSFYSEFSIKKFVTIILTLISMLMIGTRISSYLSILIIFIMFIAYIVLCCCFKIKKFNRKVFKYNLLIILIMIPFIVFSPITFATDRIMPKESIDYVKNNDLLNVVEKYKKELNTEITDTQKSNIENFIRKNHQYFSITKGQAPDKYLYNDYLEFWLNYFVISYNNLNNNRDFERYLFKHIYKTNDNNFDFLLGYGYSQTFNSGVILENDVLYHFYTLGIFGILIFIAPYFIILIYSIIKVLLNIKEKLNFENVTYIFILGVMLTISIIGGNILDFFLVNIFLSFICGQLLYNVRITKEVKNLKKEAKNKKMISVIVPVYNVEKYIEKCVDSLVNQTIEDKEIILVDDGSTDNTSKILDEYAKKYPEIVKVIHKENEGVSVARNVGIEIATGEYIGFIDSDDWVEFDMYEKLYNKAVEDDCDVVACNITALYPDHEVIIKSNIRDNETAKELMIDAYAIVCNKIYKKSLIENIRFKEKMNFCEDVRFLYMLYPKIKKIGSIDESLYNYLQRTGSLTYTYNEKLYQLIDSLDDIVKYYKDENIYEIYIEELEYSYARYLYATFIKRLAKTKNKKEFDKGVNFVINKVRENFPNYKKNKYIKRLDAKSLYLKHFNKTIANLIFKLEKNRLN